MRALLVALTLLASIGFYNYHDVISDRIKVVILVSFILISGLYALQFRQTDLREPELPRNAWLILFAGILISVPMAFLIHGQSILLTLTATASYFFPLLFLPILLILNPSPKILFRYFFAMCGISILVYMANAATFPNNIFGPPLREDLTRGILRVPVPFLQLMLLLFFYSINQFRLTEKKIWLGSVAICIIMILLSVIRQVILISFVLGLLQFMQKFVWYKKVLVGTVIAGTAFLIFINLPMYQSMMELSEDQYEDSAVMDKEDLRVGAWRYYALEAQQEAPASILFGNGAPSLENSTWGKELYNFSEDNTYFMADVSLAGFYFRFGLIATIALLYILISAILKKKTPQKQYLSYFLACCVLESIASGVFEYHFELLIIVVALYLVYRPEEEDDTETVEDVKPEKPLPQHRFVIH